MAPTNTEATIKPLQNGNPVLNNMPNKENEEIDDLVRDCNQKLYEGDQKYSKLSFLLRLYHIKCLCDVIDKAMKMILELLKDAFEYANIPNSFYEAKKIIYKFGLNYTKIDVCLRNCMFYWGEDENLEICKHCKKSRWKAKGTNDKKKLHTKVLRYFSLKPRLQSNLDGLLRHPRDAKAWRSFDQLYPEFALEPRNFRRQLPSIVEPHFGPIVLAFDFLWPLDFASGPMRRNSRNEFNLHSGPIQ
ncbi:hypothetical protein CR513_41732, partial [Mucuna pruriens]